MLLQRALLLSSLVLSSLASPSKHTKEDDSPSWPTLAALLDTIDSTVLHGVLHQLAPRFQDGVFSKDRSAIEHVHSENPAVASKLVHIALKRQASNSTTTSKTTSKNTASASSQAASISSALSSALHASTVPKQTTVLVAPSAPAHATAIATVDGGIVYSTIGGGVVTLSSSAIDVSFVQSSDTSVFVTTLPDGSVQTQTSVVVVNAPVTSTDAAGTAGAAATTGSPGLQNSATGLRDSGILILFACIGGLALLL